MDVQVAFYHGIREQVRRVVTALGPERTDKGLDAFETGHSNWHHCFFARALSDDKVFQQECGEIGVAKALGLITTDGTPNLIPVRIVYHAFDGLSKLLKREEVKQLIIDCRDEQRPEEVMQLLRSIDFRGAEQTPARIEALCQT